MHMALREHAENLYRAKPMLAQSRKHGTPPKTIPISLDNQNSFRDGPPRAKGIKMENDEKI